LITAMNIGQTFEVHILTINQPMLNAMADC
jgi:hypothetical protein